MGNNHNLTIDNTKVLLIFLVVFGHCLELVQTSIGLQIYQLIYLFHMPAFLFISGFVYKPNIKQSVLWLFIPYLLIQSIHFIYAFITKGSDSFWTILAEPYWAMWYLLSLFSMHVLTFLLPKKKSYQILYFIGAVVIGLLAGFVHEIDHSFSVSRTLVFYPYFIAGYLIKFYKGTQFSYKIPKKVWSIMISVLFVVGLIIIAPMFDKVWLYGKSGYVDGNTFYIRIVLYIIGFLSIFLLLGWISHKQTFVTKLSSNTLLIYLVHPFILLLLKDLHITLSILESLTISIVILLLCSLNLLHIRKHHRQINQSNSS